jgi:hypothetical protein
MTLLERVVVAVMREITDEDLKRRDRVVTEQDRLDVAVEDLQDNLNEIRLADLDFNH